jgi:hypothetical protein
MATSRHESDCAPERKRARGIVDPSSTALSSSAAPIAVQSRWQWTSTSASSSVNNSYFDAAVRNVASPGVGGNSSDSISLSGSSTDQGGVQPKTSPASTPAVVSSPSFNMTMPNNTKSSAISTNASTQNDLRPFLIRPSLLIDQQNGANAGSGASVISPAVSSAVGIVAPWQIQDYGEALAFDGSLSGLSDLAGPGYVK